MDPGLGQARLRNPRSASTMHRNVVIAGYVRSPHHFANKGDLRKVRPDDLTAQVVNGLLARTGVDPAEIEDLILGCAFPEGEQGFNMARMVVLLAGLPPSIGGTTLDHGRAAGEDQSC